MESAELLTFLRDRVELLTGFPEDRIRELVDGSRIITFEGNEAVVECGDEGWFLGIMLTGEAEASVTDNSGRYIRLSLLGPGSIFGEIALMTGNKTIANIVGITRCSALLIPQQLFSTMLITQPSAIRYLSRLMTERMTQWTGIHHLAAEALQKSDDPYGLRLKTALPEKILVLNCGAVLFRYALFDTADEARVVRGSIYGIGTESAVHRVMVSGKETVIPVEKNCSHHDAFRAMLSALVSKEVASIRGAEDITCVGHRVVHGGDKLSTPAIINDGVIASIKEAASLAPLHNPSNLTGIEEARAMFPLVPHVAVYDSGFHHTLPPYAYMYGLPYEFYKKKIRRYGFHGQAHLYAGLKTAEHLKRPFDELEIISCHLGNGSSLCAVDHGRSVDTTMGFTPTQGVLMATRCGDLDPGILIHLMRTEKMGPDDLETLLNFRSGFKGVSGAHSDMREIEKSAQQGDHRSLLAYKMFCYQIRKYIGSYVAAMQGIDAVVFSGGIGQRSAGVRSLACQGLKCMGIELDEMKNSAIDALEGTVDISLEGSPVKVLVVKGDVERMIARETIRSVSTGYIADIIQTQKNTPVPVEISAHHVHLSADHVAMLFGPDHTLTPVHELSQPGQFACVETVNLIGPKGRVDRVRVLGPVRRETQVEIAMTEQFKLGIHPPIRESGDLENTPGTTIEGTAGRITLSRGVICALRHIHMSPEDALKFGLRDKCKVRVRIEGERELIFGDVLIRVSPSFRLAMHIDTDEANAGNVKEGAVGHIEAIQAKD